MGRYFNGDIDGKFWFAVQSSDAADRFGVEGVTPNYMDYWFQEDDLESVESEIESIKEKIGKDNLKLLDTFFNRTEGYNDSILEENGISTELWNEHKSDYADLGLGIKIRDCIKENGDCSFTAEL